MKKVSPSKNLMCCKIEQQDKSFFSANVIKSLLVANVIKKLTTACCKSYKKNHAAKVIKKLTCCKC
jgi:hypothetical protein